jgi:hypothetical protein
MDRKPEITENTSLPQSKGLHIKRNLELDIKRRIETAEFVQHLPTSIHAPTEELRQSSMIIAEIRSYLEQLRNEENLPPVLQRTINAIGQETINDERFLLQVAREEALLYDDFETPLRYRQQRRLEILPTALRHAHAIYTFSRQYKDALRNQYIDQLTGLRNRRCIMN